MRDSIKELLTKSYYLKFCLPTPTIKKTSLTTLQDHCFEPFDDDSVAESIYQSILDYCLNETEIDITKLDNNQIMAIENRLRYSSDDKIDNQLKYGFFGETLLNILIEVFFCTKKIIAKGYFYSPLEKAEPKGYDCFHFVEDTFGNKEFWFGESKMYCSLYQASKSVFGNINKALSKEYYETNLRTILSRVNDLDITSASPIFKKIFVKMRDEKISLYNEFVENNIKVVYPILICFNDNSETFETKILNSINTIEEELLNVSIVNGIEADILFILIPVESVINIKKDVLKWISQKKPII